MLLLLKTLACKTEVSKGLVNGHDRLIGYHFLLGELVEQICAKSLSLLVISTNFHKVVCGGLVSLVRWPHSGLSYIS